MTKLKFCIIQRRAFKKAPPYFGRWSGFLLVVCILESFVLSKISFSLVRLRRRARRRSARVRAQVCAAAAVRLCRVSGWSFVCKFFIKKAGALYSARLIPSSPMRGAGPRQHHGNELPCRPSPSTRQKQYNTVQRKSQDFSFNLSRI